MDCMPPISMIALVNHSFCLREQPLIPKIQRETHNPLIWDCLSWLLITQTSSEVKPDTEPPIIQTFGDYQALLEDSDKELKGFSDEELLATRDDM
ncbi:hypothetical protein Tco_0380709, partial [Tanacetum coccineum]